jgi:actin-like ATPase involved in cell morphogenesis
MPSSVYVESPDHIDVGEVALNRAAADPTRFIREPKRQLSLDQTDLPVADTDVPAHVVVAAIVRAAVDKARAQHAGEQPSGLVLTHPEQWSDRQIQVLTDAAALVGFSGTSVRTLSEPRAAAHHYAHNGELPPGTRVAVFDFGGGTLDVAVLTAADGSFTVVAAQGDNALGGRNFDASVHRWVEQQLTAGDPDLLAWLGTTDAAHARLALAESIRTAKELLSDAAQATIAVPTSSSAPRPLHLTRTEFEELIDRDVARGVDLLRSTLRMAGVPEGDLSAIYLVGGSSRIPLVHTRVAALGPVVTLDDPKTVVAHGAMSAAAAGGLAAPRVAAAEPSGPAPPLRSPRWRRRGRVLAAGVTLGIAIAIAAALGIRATHEHRAVPASAASALTTSSTVDSSQHPSMASVEAAFPDRLRSLAVCNVAIGLHHGILHLYEYTCTIPADRWDSQSIVPPAALLGFSCALAPDIPAVVDFLSANPSLDTLINDNGIKAAYDSEDRMLLYFNTHSRLVVIVPNLVDEQAADTFLTHAGLKVVA